MTIFPVDFIDLFVKFVKALSILRHCVRSLGLSSYTWVSAYCSSTLKLHLTFTSDIKILRIRSYDSTAEFSRYYPSYLSWTKFINVTSTFKPILSVYDFRQHRTVALVINLIKWYMIHDPVQPIDINIVFDIFDLKFNTL